MYKSLEKADEAALDGDAHGFNTQQCQGLQAQFLSRSPCSPKIEAGNTENACNSKQTAFDEALSHANTGLSVYREAFLAADGKTGENEQTDLPSAPTPEFERIDNGTTPRKTSLRRDSNGTLRCFDYEEKKRKIPDLEIQPLTQSRAVMEDSSQRSSLLTPTQANSESVYEHFSNVNLQRKLGGQYAGGTQEEAANDEGLREHTQTIQESVISKQHHSAVTDSTAFTYGENDTGHVHLDFVPLENPELDQNMSQDTSFAPRQQELSNEYSYEPRTPAPPMNPFSQRGSVMKGYEMFGATQPSSIGKYVASPTSSRPSPDVYNNSSLQRRIVTSPLGGHGQETSPLQSTVRILLRAESTESLPRAVTQSVISSRSFNFKRREPRNVYQSVSQEFRNKHASTSPPNLDSDTESESEVKHRNLQRKEKRKLSAIDQAQKELAQVTSSRPGSGSVGVVEVPSTVQRRRSLEEEYITQCDGLGARDIQQEDVIVDSQALVEEPEAIDLPQTATATKPNASEAEPAASRKSRGMYSPKSSQELLARAASIEQQRVLDLYPNSQVDDAFSQSKDPGSPLKQPSLPQQEAPTNRNDLRTPITSKTQFLSDGTNNTIPNTILETSPLGDERIRPMAEIASLSFGDNSRDSVIDDAPGFTQDIEFDNLIRPQLSPTPPTLRLRVRDGDYPDFEAPAMTADTQSTPNESHLPQPCRAGPDDGTTIVAASRVYRDGFAADYNDRLDETERQAKSLVQGGNNQRAIPALPINDPRNEDSDAADTGYNDDDEPAQSAKQSKEASNAGITSLKAPAVKRRVLRRKKEGKGPSKALKPSEEVATLHASAQRPIVQPTKSTYRDKITSSHSSKRVSEASSVLSSPISPLASPLGSGTGSSTRKRNVIDTRLDGPAPVPFMKASTRKSTTQASLPKEKTSAPLPRIRQASRRSALQTQEAREHTPASATTRFSKRKSIVDKGEPFTVRSSKRQHFSHAARESSENLLAHSVSTLNSVARIKKVNGLFFQMAFAVSYVRQEKEKLHVSDLISEHGGRILEEGFDCLFETGSKSQTQGSNEEAELVLSAVAKSVGFTALIADEHSRKAKYMQALALGLPCISGRWILGCVAKGKAIDWAPYLLCAGQSSFLGDAIRSRTLATYSVTDASFKHTFSSREKLLDGKSILLVTGKGPAEVKRKAYVFLTRVLGPARVSQVVDYEEAKRKLLEDNDWDMLYVDKNERAADAAVFGSALPANSVSKKRKRDPTTAEEVTCLTPRRIRVIGDEFVVQSLILGKLIEE